MSTDYAMRVFAVLDIVIGLCIFIMAPLYGLGFLWAMAAGYAGMTCVISGVTGWARAMQS